MKKRLNPRFNDSNPNFNVGSQQWSSSSLFHDCTNRITLKPWTSVAWAIIDGPGKCLRNSPFEFQILPKPDLNFDVNLDTIVNLVLSLIKLVYFAAYLYTHNTCFLYSTCTKHGILSLCIFLFERSLVLKKNEFYFTFSQTYSNYEIKIIWGRNGEHEHNTITRAVIHTHIVESEREGNRTKIIRHTHKSVYEHKTNSYTHSYMYICIYVCI